MRRPLTALLLLAATAAAGARLVASPQPQPVADSQAGRIPEGVYYGVRTNLATGHVIKVYVTFLADGRVFAGYPKEGLDVPTTWERECRYHDCGTYTRSGDQVTMRWTGGRAPRTETFRLDAQDVLSTTTRPVTTYRRARLLDGPLEGRYGIESARENFTSTEISFRRDGGVSDERVLWWTAWDQDSDANTGGSEQVVRRGTYTIRKGTLRLRFEDGTSGARFIMVPPRGDVARSVQIGGNYDYLRIPDLP